MSQDALSLDSLGLECGTDKSSWQHNYLQFYEFYFGQFRTKRIKLLEIGVAGGASLRVWERYFQSATIIGADINPNAVRFQRDRVSIEIIDQSNVNDLNVLGTKHGPFDIILDDGSHMWEHQITTLRTMFPFLTDDGIYVVEDLQTNFGQLQKDFRGLADFSCVEYLKKLVDIRVGDELIDISGEQDAFLKKYGRSIKSVVFHRHACLIQNGYRKTADKPFVVVRNDDSVNMISIRAHIGGYGDRKSDGPVILGRGEQQNIQGFSINVSSLLKDELSYRARLQSGAWTEWATNGEFVGTRGMSEDLTGFSVRLTGRAQKNYDMTVVGAFRGNSTNVNARSGEECVPSARSQKLWGMQIIIVNRSGGQAHGVC